MNLFKGAEWVWNLVQFFIFLGAIASIGLLAYIYLYEPDYFFKKQHKQLKEDFKVYNDSITPLVEILNDSLIILRERQKGTADSLAIYSKKNIENQKELLILSQELEAITNSEKKFHEEFDSISNSDLDRWTINRYGK
jgi:hypothetical protein